MAASLHSASAHDGLAASPGRVPASSQAALRHRTGITSPLSLWHLLSLDAPTVAALWVVFIGRTAHVPLPWTGPAAMFLGVWILYAADRLLDSRNSRCSSGPNTLEARHYFHAEHRGAFLLVIILAALALALLLPDIPSAAIRLYLILGAFLLAWLLLIHLRPAASRLPKELAVGVFFPAAIFIPAVARAPWLRSALFPEAIFFAAICSLNCLYIFAWEHPIDRHNAHWSTRTAVRHLPALTIATLVGSLSIAALRMVHPQTASWPLAGLPAIACAASAALLLQLHRSRTRLSPLHLRAAADLCLLTPALLLPFLPGLR